MTAASQAGYYSLTLFLALVALNLWTGRRHRLPRALRTWDAVAHFGDE